MKYLSIPILLLMLAGCSTTHVALSNAEQPGAGAGILRIAWLGPDRAEILLEGKAYVGEWADSLCFTPQCRGVFFNVAKIERRHVRRGSAELFAKDQASLSCEWVSHKKELVGTCQADDGRVFQLKGA